MTLNRPPWRFEARTRDELAELAGRCTAVLPLGSTEQHGHHLPVCVDTHVVTAIAERAVQAAAETVPVVVLPALPYGVAAHHLQFGGTASIRSTTYVDLLTDLIAGLGQQGFTRLVLLNGHGGNESAMQLAAGRAIDELGVPVTVAATSYWQVAADALAGAGFDPPLTPGHAGHVETSLMLALSPELVHLERRPDDDGRTLALAADPHPGVQVRALGRWRASDGRTDDASAASAELGAKVLTQVVAAVAAFLVAFHATPEPVR